jgi:hypothetical protein
MSTDANPPFRLGLVMAGAVSAGAYTAGVLDFLFEALMEWEKEKKAKPNDTPNHNVIIDAISGASAGGSSAALSCILPALGYYPVPTPDHDNASRNLLYQAWVKNIDLLGMLECSDLKTTVPSLLSGNPLEMTARTAVKDALEAIKANKAQWPVWLADNVRVYLTLTNTKGIPYILEMLDAEGKVQKNPDGKPYGHYMMVHGDVACFITGKNPSGNEGYLLPYDSLVKEKWEQLTDAALATSAFPVGLPARKFTQQSKVYSTDWWLDYHGLKNDTVSVKPALDEEYKESYPFYALDGGAINNEPLELVRRYLARDKSDKCNPVLPDKADAATIMIDPFPDTAPNSKDFGEVFDVLDSFSTLLNSMKAQCRFKPKDLLLALDRATYSRYLISPSRKDKKDQETHLASAGIGGFAGFFHEELREHDFFLGRRNCQRFLENHFNVSVNNPIVKDWVARLQQNGTLEDFHPMVYSEKEGRNIIDKTVVRLVPLFGTAADAARNYNPPYPKLNFETDIKERLQKPLQKRCYRFLEVTFEYLAKKLFSGATTRFLVRNTAPELWDDNLAEKIMKIIEDDLKSRGLLKDES